MGLEQLHKIQSGLDPLSGLDLAHTHRRRTTAIVEDWKKHQRSRSRGDQVEGKARRLECSLSLDLIAQAIILFKRS